MDAVHIAAQTTDRATLTCCLSVPPDNNPVTDIDPGALVLARVNGGLTCFRAAVARSHQYAKFEALIMLFNCALSQDIDTQTQGISILVSGSEMMPKVLRRTSFHGALIMPPLR